MPVVFLLISFMPICMICFFYAQKQLDCFSAS